MDKYEKVRVLGKGSFGSAILIKRKSDGSLFVVKEVSLTKMSKKERDEARHECTVLQQLKHPNIVRYVEQFENRNNLYIVMEYCDGGDLAQKVKQSRGPMKESVVMYYFSQVCLAMEYLHSRHILHRDIKTMNVFLMKNGAVKLGDFGISTVLRNTMGMANTVCGTPYYFSPELCRNKPYNNKSDIWAMGVLLYECATGGKHPFDGNNMNQLMQRIVKGSYSPLSSQYSSEFRKMVDWCLQKDPSKRPSIRQTLSYPLVRSSLERLEENLMLATQCRVRLKDIIDFESAMDNDSKSQQQQQQPQQQDKACPIAEEKQLLPSKDYPAGVSPGQAAAMAMAKLAQQQQQQQQQQKPRNPYDLRPSSPAVSAGAVVGPKPGGLAHDRLGGGAAAAANNNNNRAINNFTPAYYNNPTHQQQVLHRLRQPNAAFVNNLNNKPIERKPLDTPGLRLDRPTACDPLVDPRARNIQDNNNNNNAIENARRGNNLEVQNDRFGDNMNRINAIMAKYGKNVDEEARETIHAYMKRKQEEYLQRQREEIEKRERRNDMRQKELKRVLELQQHQRAANAASPRQRSNVGKTEQNPPPSEPKQNNDVKSKNISSRAVDSTPPASPVRGPATPQAIKPGFGRDPRGVHASPSSVRNQRGRLGGKAAPAAAAAGVRRPVSQQQRKVAVAANSPRMNFDCRPTGLGCRPSQPVIPNSAAAVASGGATPGPSPRAQQQADRLAAQKEREEKLRGLREEARLLAVKDQRDRIPHGIKGDLPLETGAGAPQSACTPLRQQKQQPQSTPPSRDPNHYGRHGGLLASPGSGPSKAGGGNPFLRQPGQRRPFSTEESNRLNAQSPRRLKAPGAGDSPSLFVSPIHPQRGLTPSNGKSNKEARREIASPQRAAQVPSLDAKDIPELDVGGAPLCSHHSPAHVSGDPRYHRPKTHSHGILSPLAPPQPPAVVSGESPQRRASVLPPVGGESHLVGAGGALTGHQIRPQPQPLREKERVADLVDVPYGAGRDIPDTNAAPVQDALRVLRQRSGLLGAHRTGAEAVAPQPLYIPSKQSGPTALLHRHLSTDAALYGGMRHEAHPKAEIQFVQEQKRLKQEDESAVPSMLETLRGLRQEERRVESSQLTLLKQRHSLQTGFGSASENGGIKAVALPVTALSLGDLTDLRRPSSSSVGNAAPPLSADGEQRGSVDGYSEMLQHLKDLLQKRKVNVKTNTSDRTGGAAQVSSKTTFSLPSPCMSREVLLSEEDSGVFGLESPPRLQCTRSVGACRSPGLSEHPKDEENAAEEINDDDDGNEEDEDENGTNDDDEEEVDDDDEDFEDAVPLSPVRCAELNDTYVRALREEEPNASANVYSDDVFLNGASKEMEEIDEDGYTGYYRLPSADAIMKSA